MSERISGIPGLAARIANWWCRRNLHAAFNTDDIARLAHDIGRSSHELTGLVAQEGDAASLLRERMTAPGVASPDVERIAFGLMHVLLRHGRLRRGSCNASRRCGLEEPLPNVLVDALRLSYITTVQGLTLARRQVLEHVVSVQRF
jgi:hypothetical protein